MKTDGKTNGKSNGLKLDDRDLRILAILQREGRLSKADLARRVNLSATPCWERLRQLETAGVIERYEAHIALAPFAPVLRMVVSVELDSRRPEVQARFEAGILAFPEVYACEGLGGGGVDYLLRVITRDVTGYRQLMDRVLDAGLGVRRHAGHVVERVVKRDPPPLTPLHPAYRG
ncbi:Lrp/AsnC family transcriptional regulator [Roseospira visakhapatnamensis]|uniref:Lrp/AsnC family transcriptional regulator of ectoine degradation n=1 Tax=Roseospira visakhapatnamensis TaxID=390880 RepID=A0A7W6RBM5_9PROT|nr:Lrp/AsnC family transcriptional regulator [Roseospira visakhapatnamensis]MBB4264898.1 Lrp/AsnC family transcriptional regulator of ectoine degradation [Roseospira visakhapatnamensis]